MKYPKYCQIEDPYHEERLENEKVRELAFQFEVKMLGRFRLVIPKKMLSETQTEIYAKTITGSKISFRILIRRMRFLEVMEINPSLAGVHPVWILRHVATSPYNNRC